MEEQYASQEQPDRESSHRSVKKKHTVPFQCMISIPTGFQIQKPNTPKLVYDVSHLSMAKEMCKRVIDVEDCGQVEIDLHVLKIKGVLPFIVNVSIEPLHMEQVYTTSGRDMSLFLSCQETVYVDHILKYSVDHVPYYVIDGRHIQVRDVSIKGMEDNPQMAQIAGVFYFDYA
ncbi:hypothetical protein BK726_02025 [Bacillus thuringiensis serovar londrina]|uniref:Uncharacterized protein n=1 Tax=Bacillus thuringiensis TaxID=1428 RepID=X2KX82_BACTU|nr:hypothetical protein [Bacillus thuringiensis]AHN91994.1 hypothetical protein [Bacillus thuringiensis]AOB42266.1 putative 20 kDa protein in cryB1 5'region (ORF1) [Bacillus thuringiensis]OMH24297.1 hypothetical protein BUM91_30655 [Bacillus thuringiensis]OTX96000.1 hypothetical protein BK726_02025 [Bacillus thuringiensis serovar londrina]